MSKQQAAEQLKACEATLASNAGTEAIVFACIGKRVALKVLAGK